MPEGVYEYECSEGHDLSGPKEILSCPAYNKGVPCKGALKRIGWGSRPVKKAERELDLTELIIEEGAMS